MLYKNPLLLLVPSLLNIQPLKLKVKKMYICLNNILTKATYSIFKENSNNGKWLRTKTWLLTIVSNSFLMASAIWIECGKWMKLVFSCHALFCIEENITQTCWKYSQSGITFQKNWVTYLCNKQPLIRSCYISMLPSRPNSEVISSMKPSWPSTEPILLPLDFYLILPCSSFS